MSTLNRCAAVVPTAVIRALVSSLVPFCTSKRPAPLKGESPGRFLKAFVNALFSSSSPEATDGRSLRVPPFLLNV